MPAEPLGCCCPGYIPRRAPRRRGSRSAPAPSLEPLEEEEEEEEEKEEMSNAEDSHPLQSSCAFGPHPLPLLPPRVQPSPRLLPRPRLPPPPPPRHQLQSPVSAPRRRCSRPRPRRPHVAREGDPVKRATRARSRRGGRSRCTRRCSQRMARAPKTRRTRRRRSSPRLRTWIRGRASPSRRKCSRQGACGRSSCGAVCPPCFRYRPFQRYSRSGGLLLRAM